MKFFLLEMDSSTLFFLYAGGAILGWIIFYYTIKAAVKWGTLEALEDRQAVDKPVVKSIVEKPANAEQLKLQEHYNAGKISFEEYQNQWQQLAD